LPTAGPDDSIVTIDCQYLGPRRCAAYLVLEGDAAIFVDNNTKRAVPLLLDALKLHGYEPEQVSHAIVTHCHLDHAGGSLTLLNACRNARLVAHPKAARHLADPAKLVAGAKMVYGEAAFQEQFGTIEPVPEYRIDIVGDGETMQVGARTFTFHHTKGHATHHMFIHDAESNAVFAGDDFGSIYDELQIGTSPFGFCISAPVEFDPEESRVSIRKILDTGAEWAYLGHFGAHEVTQPVADQLTQSIDRCERVLNEALASGLQEMALHELITRRMREEMLAEMSACGIEMTGALEEWVGPAVALNSSGIMAAAIKRMDPR
jgi:glyoxylase-like metal-dependent hydrolase (beta-lactamase superfamily II)